eukprot:TRINITY_DN16269_c0_g1_i1.p1 TRINITY_DN16269_c0_g1~~TRINITY_DN16269_c0_g1_i1.p1  ORF type:complete len:441 (+),score=74.83 TRINITY_DN16269_c0_g1_i1:39-1325(+)
MNGDPSKYRIRPPGCADSNRYSWRYGRSVVRGFVPPEDPAKITDGVFEHLGTFEVMGEIFNVEGKGDVLRCCVEVEKVGAKELVGRLVLGGDEEEGGDGGAAILRREVVYPFLYEPRKYVLRRVSGVKEGTHFMHLYTDLEKQPKSPIPELYLNQYAEATEGPAATSLTIYDTHILGGMPHEDMKQYAPEGFARFVYKLIHGIDLVKGSLGEFADGVLPRFISSCHDQNDFKPWKDVWVSKLNKTVTVYKRHDAGLNYPTYRSEAVLESNTRDFLSMFEAMAETGGPVQKALTPECESQGIHIEDAVSRIIYKVDKLGPWPMKKREYLAISILGWTKDHAMYFPQVSIDHPDYPVSPGCVRALFNEVGFACIPVGPNKLKVIQLINVDPIGIPRVALDIAMADYANNLGTMQHILNTKDEWYKPHQAK